MDTSVRIRLLVEIPRYLADIVPLGRASICGQELSNESGRQDRISSKYKILVADDNKTNLKTAEFMLHAERAFCPPRFERCIVN